MKRVVTLFILLFAAALAFCIDCREIVFGNGFERIIECKDSELMEKISRDVFADSDFKEIKKGVLFRKLFEERYENGTIYRMLTGYVELSDENLSRMFQEKKQLHQIVLFVKNDSTHIFSNEYIYNYICGDGTTRSWAENVYNGVSVISRKNKITGLLEFKNSNRVVHHSADYDGGSSWTTSEKSCEASFFYWKDIQNESFYEKLKWWNGLMLKKSGNKDLPVIDITHSYPLIDETRPFKYTIQNAFDGNPATSFVEDTDDSLIEVYFDLSPLSKSCSNLKIINGYAQNQKLYGDNNRIKKILSSGDSHSSAILKDNQLEPQIIKWPAFDVSANELYKGNKYNDTCIAELDFQSEDGSWIFDVITE